MSWILFGIALLAAVRCGLGWMMAVERIDYLYELQAAQDARMRRLKADLDAKVEKP